MAFRPSRPGLAGRALLAAALTTAAALAERRHLRAIAGDPEYHALSAPLGGRPLDPIVSADGTTLHAERFGAPDGAAATLVLAHGWTERIAWWGPVIRRLTDPAAPDLQIVAYDLRGHGRSGAAAGGDYALERFGEDVEAVLEAAGGDPAATVIAGHSLGAMSIAAWAAGFSVSERVAAAALVCTGLSDLIGGALLFGTVGARLAPARLSRALLSSGRPLLPVSTPLSQRAERRVAFGPDASRGVVSFYERMLMETDPSARAAVGIALSTLDLSAAVARITVPTLVVCGHDDRLTPPAHAHRIHDALPDPLPLLELPRTGHMAALERPDELADALRGLLAACEAGPSPAARSAAPAVAAEDSA